MKRLSLFFISIISFSQINMSIDFVEYFEFNDASQDFILVNSDDSQISFFEFQSLPPNEMTMFTHKTSTMQSTYSINKHTEIEESDNTLDQFDIVSDVGNEYVLRVDIKNEKLFFMYEDNRGKALATIFHIKAIWNTEEDNINESNKEFDFYNYFDNRDVKYLDPIEGIWSLNVERRVYYLDSLIHTEYEEMRSEWAIAISKEFNKLRVYDLQFFEDSSKVGLDFNAFFEPTALPGFYNYTCTFFPSDSIHWEAKSNATLTDNAILNYGYYVPNEVAGNYSPIKIENMDGLSLFWDFTWVKKYPINETFNKNKLETSNPKGWLGNGSGFFINTEGYLVTNYHVIDGASDFQIEYYRNGELQKQKAILVKEDKQNDLAILKINSENFKPFKKIPYNFTSKTIDIGSEVFALGYPWALNGMGTEIKFTDGKISAVTGWGGDVRYYQTTTPIQGGNSGGPLFDSNGNLIGINTLKLESIDIENVSYAIKSNYLKSLIDALPETIKVPKNKKIKRKKLTEKINMIKPYVVLILVK